MIALTPHVTERGTLGKGEGALGVRREEDGARRLDHAAGVRVVRMAVNLGVVENGHGIPARKWREVRRDVAARCVVVVVLDVEVARRFVDVEVARERRRASSRASASAHQRAPASGTRTPARGRKRLSFCF